MSTCFSISGPHNLGKAVDYNRFFHILSRKRTGIDADIRLVKELSEVIVGPAETTIESPGGAINDAETAQSKVTSAMVFDYTAIKEKYDISLSMTAYGSGMEEEPEVHPGVDDKIF